MVHNVTVGNSESGKNDSKENWKSIQLLLCALKSWKKL